MYRNTDDALFTLSYLLQPKYHSITPTAYNGSSNGVLQKWRLVRSYGTSRLACILYIPYHPEKSRERFLVFHNGGFPLTIPSRYTLHHNTYYSPSIIRCHRLRTMCRWSQGGLEKMAPRMILSHFEIYMYFIYSISSGIIKGMVLCLSWRRISTHHPISVSRKDRTWKYIFIFLQTIKARLCEIFLLRINNIMKLYTHPIAFVIAVINHSLIGGLRFSND